MISHPSHPTDPAAKSIGLSASVATDLGTAARLVDEVLDDVELILDCDCVHRDLSPYNVVHDRGRGVIIDFPQAGDPRLNHAGCALLFRDVENMCRWATQHGVDRPAAKIGSGLWQRFRVGELG